MKNYETELRKLIQHDNRLSGKYKIGRYCPELQYEADAGNTAETYDVFVVTVVHSGRVAYLSYGDEDGYRVSSLRTVERHVRRCNV